MQDSVTMAEEETREGNYMRDPLGKPYEQSRSTLLSQQPANGHSDNTSHPK